MAKSTLMSKTDTDWQALDARIAREVMGRLDGQMAPSLRLIDKAPPDSEACDLYQVVRPVWQPHKNVAQALMVKDKIVRDDWCFDLSNRPGTLAVVYFWQMLHPMIGIQGKAESDAKAICLATEAWLDAQKEKQDDPG